jgi:gluconate 2-dehydrogenase gamma chain
MEGGIMANKDKAEPANFGRREMMKRVGVAGAAVAVPAVDLGKPTQAQAATARAPAPAREALETLTAAESDTLEAIVARIIPTDENGPGAAEARAAHYIDRALTGPLASRKAAYVSGLAAVDAYAQSSKGAAFARLSARDQDAVLTDMEKNAATGFNPNSAAFFNLVRNHTIQGTFCDPYYGGNANYVGWDLIGYPGVRMAVSAEEQSMSKPPKVVRKSAYDEPLFSKRGGSGHGH